MIEFVLAVFFLMITPGPGVLSTAGVGAAYGPKAGATYIAGLFIGTNLVALAVVTGIAALILGTPGLRTGLAIASTLYMLYLAAKIAFSGAKVAFIQATKPPGIKGGLMLQAINPKAYAVNTLIFANFSLYPGSLTTELIAKFIVVNLIWIPIHFLWLGAGVALHSLNLAPPTQRAINIAMALALLIVVGLAAVSLMPSNAG